MGKECIIVDDWDPATAFDLKTKGFIGFITAAILLCIPYQQRSKSGGILNSFSRVPMEEPARTSRSNLNSGGNGGVHASQEPSLKVGVVLSDERVDFLREQAFCVLRVKTDKWNRFIGTEENQKMILDFLDHIWTDKLLLYSGPGGTLHAGNAQVWSPHRQLC